ncbi:MAG: methylcrotonoyl-CoA carboxylase, partial [Mameliella sp.]|nr:methylcrotonoyl-CoA carboxylase [Mameliella sp.]
MSILQSSIGPNSPGFAENAEAMEAQYAEVAEKAGRIMQGGSESSRQRHVSRGKLLPRDRIAGLLDAGSPFLEVGLFAASGMYGDDVPS